MIDAVALAKTVTSLLVPALPYLLKGSEQAWEEASKKIGSDTWEWAKAVWAKIMSRSKTKSIGDEKITEIMKAATEVANNSSDEDAQAALRLQIRKLFVNDLELSHEIEKILNTAKISSEQTGIRTGGIDISGESTITNSGNIVGGNQVINS